jgi:hypothetical protein
MHQKPLGGQKELGPTRVAHSDLQTPCLNSSGDEEGGEDRDRTEGKGDLLDTLQC